MFHQNDINLDYACLISADASGISCAQNDDLHDAVEMYFACIESCNLDDPHCKQHCVEDLKVAETI